MVNLFSGFMAEFFARFFRHVVVFRCHVRADDAQFTDGVGFGYRLAVFIFQKRGYSIKWLPQHSRPTLSERIGKHSRTFTCPVKFEDTRIAIHMLRHRFFSGYKEIINRKNSEYLAHCSVHCRRHENPGYPIGFHDLIKQVDIFPFRFICDIKTAAVIKRRGQIHQRSGKCEHCDTQRIRLTGKGN